MDNLKPNIGSRRRSKTADELYIKNIDRDGGIQRTGSQNSVPLGRTSSASVSPLNLKTTGRSHSGGFMFPNMRILETNSNEFQSNPMDTNHHWSESLEAIARNYMQQASGFSWMYEKMVTRAKFWGGFLSIIAGLLSGAVGTTGLVGAFAREDRQPFWLSITIAVISYVVSLLITLENILELEATKSKSLVAQVEYSHLCRSIQFQLALKPEERQDAIEFMQCIITEIDSLKLTSPMITDNAKNAYIKAFRNNPIYSGIEEIHIEHPAPSRTWNHRDNSEVFRRRIESIIENYEMRARAS